jgi:hypothetical protein
MCVLTHRDVAQFLRDVVYDSSEEMDILDEDISILHPYYAGAFEFPIL